MAERKKTVPKENRLVSDAKRLRKEGQTLPKIAASLNISKATVSRYLAKV